MEHLHIAARISEEAALELARKGRGLFGRRERHAERLVGQFVAQALEVPPGGVLPPAVRSELATRIDHTVDALETYVGRRGKRSRRRTMHDSTIVQHIYGLREAQQIITSTRRMP